MAPKLWLALKPTQAFHIVVSRVITGQTASSRASELRIPGMQLPADGTCTEQVDEAQQQDDRPRSRR